MDDSRDPWKLTTVAMAMVVVGATLTVAISANWSARRDLRGEAAALGSASPSLRAAPVATQEPSGGAQAIWQKPKPLPSQAAIDACSRYAGGRAGRAKPAVVREAPPGGDVGGLDENKKGDERFRQAYASCMRLRGYAG